MQIPNQFFNATYTNNNDIFEMFTHNITSLKNSSESKKEYQVSILKLSQLLRIETKIVHRSTN